ncbi:MAG: tRNA (adenosine(37)-N6)-threonylcarbamoyltransferase complex ATPase subunit type 1 TsaE [Candidatus Omnitrophica bacterium]|nr:tRNA (adenosine(37)-N6)-threonylcarbamoyltransferase complex ATPase subunit type 1 TsaE [Candidatus Omnitrophota bacterium]
MIRTITTRSVEETILLGCKIGRSLCAGDVVALIGALGAGKTVFVKGIAKGIGYDDHRYVNSPTFVVVKEYKGRIDLYHFDVYRLNTYDFEETIDLDRYFYGDGVSVVEWADKIEDILPDEYLEISICDKGENEREFTFRGIGERFAVIVAGIAC